MQNDPIAEAINATAQAVGGLLQQALTQGLEITPTANGSFLVRIASANDAGDGDGTQLERRAW